MWRRAVRAVLLEEETSALKPAWGLGGVLGMPPTPMTGVYPAAESEAAF